MTPIFFPNTTLIYINKQNNKVEINITGISKIKKDSGTRNSPLVEKTAQAPIIPRVLNIFDPITFPIAISEQPFFTATIDADISGKDVPKAIIVSPINVSGTLNSEAILTEEFTTASADIINIMIPKKINKIVFNKDNFLLILFSSVGFPLFLEIYAIYIKNIIKTKIKTIPQEKDIDFAPTLIEKNIRDEKNNQKI